ncbi:MAG: hypothetical protein ACRDJW_13195 [Thermomicrobiales bacterium]
MSMEQAKRGAEHISGVSNVTFDLISVLHNRLEGIAALEEYRQDADDADDGEVSTFFAECQRQARTDVERLRGMLATRIGGGGHAWAATETGEVFTEPR